jgi:hypothetical protein
MPSLQASEWIFNDYMNVIINLKVNLCKLSVTNL